MLGKRVSPDGGSKIRIVEFSSSGAALSIWTEMARFEGKGRLLHGIETCSHNCSEN